MRPTHPRGPEGPSLASKIAFNISSSGIEACMVSSAFMSFHLLLPTPTLLRHTHVVYLLMKQNKSHSGFDGIIQMTVSSFFLSRVFLRGTWAPLSTDETGLKKNPGTSLLNQHTKIAFGFLMISLQCSEDTQKCKWTDRGEMHARTRLCTPVRNWNKVRESGTWERISTAFLWHLVCVLSSLVSPLIFPSAFNSHRPFASTN